MLRESDTDSDQEQVLPLVMASALMPIELVITLMLLGSPGTIPTARRRHGWRRWRRWLSPRHSWSVQA